jgi:hypothetical protein
MGSIIQFPRSEYAFSSLQVEFLQTCHNVLCEDDYLDLLEAIEDVHAYWEADDEIQSLALGYLEVE